MSGEYEGEIASIVHELAINPKDFILDSNESLRKILHGQDGYSARSAVIAAAALGLLGQGLSVEDTITVLGQGVGELSAGYGH